ncbi:DUF2723 domain-containing protein [bacterium]|nr:DUF2723 domain-containing protein [candidate division CSSED10-310 bacterium]
MKSHLPPAILFLAAFLLYSFTLLPDIGFWDGPYLISLAHRLELGISSYQHPLYLLLLRMAFFLPLGDIAVRANLVSALCAALAVMQCFILLRGAAVNTPWAVAGSAFLAAGNTFWWCATEAEVYTAAMWLMLLLLTLAQRYSHDPAPRRLLLPAFLLGLGTALHQNLVMLAPGMLALLCAKPVRRRLTIHGLLLAGAAAVTGLLFLGTLAGRQVTVSSFGTVLHELRGGYFADTVTARVAPSMWPELFMQFLLLCILQIGIAPCLISLYGLLQRRGDGTVMLLTGIPFLLNLVFVINYPVEDRVFFYLPNFVILAVWTGMGFQGLAARWAKRRILVTLLAIAVMAGLAYRPMQYLRLAQRLEQAPAGMTPSGAASFFNRSSHVNARYILVPFKQGTRPATLYRELMNYLPEGTMVVDEWLHGYPIMAHYYQHVLRLRTDLDIERWWYYLKSDEEKRWFVIRMADRIEQRRLFITTTEHPMDDFLERLQAVRPVRLEPFNGGWEVKPASEARQPAVE